MVTATSAKPGRAAGIEVYELSPPVRPNEEETRAELVVRGIEHGDTSYEVRIFFDAPDADDQTPRTIDAGYAGHVSVSGHRHHLGEDDHRPRLPIDITIDVTEAFDHALDTHGGVETVTLVPMTQPTDADTEPAVSESLWRFGDFELRTHAEPAHESKHVVDEFGSVSDASS
jgi:hypothetical protein